MTLNPGYTYTIAKESHYHSGPTDSGSFNFGLVNNKLVEDSRLTNRILMLGVKPLDDPKQLLDYLHSKEILKDTEFSDLKSLHNQTGAIKAYGGQSGYYSQTGYPAADHQAAKHIGGPAMIGGTAYQAYPQGQASNQGYFSQNQREVHSTPNKNYPSSSFSLSGSISSYQERLSTSVITMLRACEVVSSPRFVESLEKFAKSRSTIVDEVALADFARRSGFDAGTVSLCESLSTNEALRSKERQIQELSQMFDNQRKGYISQLENTVKVNPKTTYILEKLSPELRFDGRNLFEILENVDRKIESFKNRNTQDSKRIEDLEKKLIESNLKVTQEIETANRIINEARIKEMKIQELVSCVRKAGNLTHSSQAEDYSTEIYALENLSGELKRAKQGAVQANFNSGAESEVLALRKQLNEAQRTAMENHTKLLQALEQAKNVEFLKAQVDSLQSENTSYRNSLTQSNDKLNRFISEQRDSQANLAAAQQQGSAERDTLVQNLQKTSAAYEKLKSEQAYLTVEVEDMRMMLKKTEIFHTETLAASTKAQADLTLKLEESDKKSLALTNQLNTAHQTLKELQDYKTSAAPSLQRLAEMEAYIPTLQAKENHLNMSYVQLQTREHGLSQFEQTLKAKDQEIATRSKQLEDYRLQLETASSENLKKRGELDAKLAEWDKLVREAEKKSHEADQKLREYERLRNQTDSQTNQLIIATTERDSLLNAKRAMEAEYTKVSAEREHLLLEVSNLKNERIGLINEHKIAIGSLLEEKKVYQGLEEQFKRLQDAYNSLYQNYQVVCEQANRSKVEGDSLVPRLNELTVENGKLKELIQMLETQTNKMELAYKEELHRNSLTINQYKNQILESDSVKNQRDSLLKEVANLTTELNHSKITREHHEPVKEQPHKVSKIAKESEVDSLALKEENSKLREDLESLIEEVKGFQAIFEENEKLKENVNSLQQDNELMAQALEEINDKIEKRQIIIVDQPEGEEEGVEEHVDVQNGQVRIEDQDDDRKRADQGGDEEEVDGLENIGPAELLKYTTEELNILKESYDQLKESYEQNLEQMEAIKRENDELKEDLIKIVGAQEGGLEEDGQEEGKNHDGQLGEEEMAGDGEQDERTNEEIIDENEQLIELLRELSQQIGALKEAYVEVINNLFTKNEEREAKGLNYAEFVTSAEEMQEQVKHSQHERGIENMRDFNKGLRESVEFYESEKNRMIARIQKIETWCREDEQGLGEGTEREQGEEGAEEGVEEQAQDGQLPDGGEEENQPQENDEELSVDKLVELLLITLQLIERIRETANAEDATESERLESIVDSINKFEQMGDSGEGNFELATILQKIVDNKVSQEGGEEFAQEEHGAEDQGQEEAGGEDGKVVHV